MQKENLCKKITREEVIQVLVEFAGIEGYKLPSSFYEGYSDEEIKEELDWIDYFRKEDRNGDS